MLLASLHVSSILALYGHYKALFSFLTYYQQAVINGLLREICLLTFKQELQLNVLHKKEITCTK